MSGEKHLRQPSTWYDIRCGCSCRLCTDWKFWFCSWIATNRKSFPYRAFFLCKIYYRVLPTLASMLIGFPASSIYMYWKLKLNTIYDPLNEHVYELIAAVFTFRIPLYVLSQWVSTNWYGSILKTWGTTNFSQVNWNYPMIGAHRCIILEPYHIYPYLSISLHISPYLSISLHISPYQTIQS